MSKKSRRPSHLKLVSSRDNPAILPEHVLPLVPTGWVVDWEEQDWTVEELEELGSSTASSLITRTPDGHSYPNRYRHWVFYLYKSFCNLSTLLFGKRENAQVEGSKGSSREDGNYRW
jgi:hypothetical protein